MLNNSNSFNFSYSCKFCDLSFAYRSSMKNHLIKIHNHVDVSNLPLLQAINIAIRNNPEQDLEMENLETIELAPENCQLV